MKSQWALLLGLVFAIIVAWFAIVNVEAVPVNWVFGTSDWPLILVILASALLGAAASGLIAMFRAVVMQRKIRGLEKEVNEKELKIAEQQNEIASLQQYASAFADTEAERRSAAGDDGPNKPLEK